MHLCGLVVGQLILIFELYLVKILYLKFSKCMLYLLEPLYFVSSIN